MKLWKAYLEKYNHGYDRMSRSQCDTTGKVISQRYDQIWINTEDATLFKKIFVTDGQTNVFIRLKSFNFIAFTKSCGTTRGPKGHITCTWIQCATFMTDRPGRPFYFTDWPEKKHKLGRGRWDLASCQVLSNFVQRFQRRSRKCLSQSEARAAILFFRSARKHKLGRGHWDLAYCQVLSNFVQRFQRRSRKYEKLTTTDGRRTTYDHNSALEPSAQVH